MGSKHSFLLVFMRVHVLRLVSVPSSRLEFSGKSLLTQVVLTRIRDSGHDSSTDCTVVELGSTCCESPRHLIPHSRIMTRTGKVSISKSGVVSTI
jgi:hypothetical protein